MAYARGFEKALFFFLDGRVPDQAGRNGAIKKNLDILDILGHFGSAKCPDFYDILDTMSGH